MKRKDAGQHRAFDEQSLPRTSKQSTLHRAAGCSPEPLSFANIDESTHVGL
jgi:hypothetical protein